MDGNTAPDPGFRSADRLLRGVARRSAPWLVVMALAEAVAVGTALWLPTVLGGVVDDVLAGREPLFALARLGAVLAVEVAAVLVSILATARITAGETAWLRRRFLGHVLALGLGRRPRSAADLTTRLVSDVLPVTATGPAVLSSVAAAVTSVGGLVALALLDWRLAAVVGAGLPITWWIVRALVTDVSALFVTYSAVLARIAERLAAALGGARTIRASGTVGREIDRVLEPLPELAAAGHGVWNAQRRASVQLGTLTPLITVGVLTVAGFGVAAGRLTPGEFVAAGVYAGLALGLLDQIEGLLDLAYARAGAARLTEVLDETPPAPGTATLPPGRGAMLLRGVTVRRDGELVLDRVDLRVPPGATVALVGASGSGVSELAMVAGGLLVPDHGEVIVDGVALRALAPSELPRAVACAFTRPALLGAPADGRAVGGATIADAIALGHPGAVAAAVVRAASTAHADPFVRRLPHGYDTPLADAPLSGGEVQRLGVARALACGARVTVLDDAASSLDVATEALVGAAITARLGGRTRLVLTHRAATAARADVVAWVQGGRIRAVAPHARLWESLEYRAVLGHGGSAPGGHETRDSRGRNARLAGSERATHRAETQDSPGWNAGLAGSERATRRAETQDSPGRNAGLAGPERATRGGAS